MSELQGDVSNPTRTSMLAPLHVNRYPTDKKITQSSKFPCAKKIFILSFRFCTKHAIREQQNETECYLTRLFVLKQQKGYFLHYITKQDMQIKTTI